MAASISILFLITGKSPIISRGGLPIGTKATAVVIAAEVLVGLAVIKLKAGGALLLLLIKIICFRETLICAKAVFVASGVPPSWNLLFIMPVIEQ